MTMPAEVREGFLFKIEKENAASHAPWIPGGPAPAVAGGWRLAALGLARGPWPHYKAGKITLISVTPPRPPPTPWALNDLCPARVARLSLSMLRTMQGPRVFFGAAGTPTRD